jgi:hypothetical protein
MKKKLPKNMISLNKKKPKGKKSRFLTKNFKNMDKIMPCPILDDASDPPGHKKTNGPAKYYFLSFWCPGGPDGWPCLLLGLLSLARP